MEAELEPAEVVQQRRRNRCAMSPLRFGLISYTLRARALGFAKIKHVRAKHPKCRTCEGAK
ncbi:MAG: hypothetical protein WD801_05830 [Gemmatimonadaceae bacterium]